MKKIDWDNWRRERLERKGSWAGLSWGAWLGIAGCVVVMIMILCVSQSGRPRTGPEKSRSQYQSPFTAHDQAVVANIPLATRMRIYTELLPLLAIGIKEVDRRYPFPPPGVREFKDLEAMQASKQILAARWGLTVDQLTIIIREGHAKMWPQR